MALLYSSLTGMQGSLKHLKLSLVADDLVLSGGYICISSKVGYFRNAFVQESREVG